jgi:DNA-damage-inducible protein J
MPVLIIYEEVFNVAQTNLTIRIDENIKQEAEGLFNKIGLNMSAAINVFFRQAIREQAIPFELKPYDKYYSGAKMERLMHSVGQAERGETITKTMAELEEMERD